MLRVTGKWTKLDIKLNKTTLWIIWIEYIIHRMDIMSKYICIMTKHPTPHLCPNANWTRSRQSGPGSAALPLPHTSPFSPPCSSASQQQSHNSCVCLLLFTSLIVPCCAYITLKSGPVHPDLMKRLPMLHNSPSPPLARHTERKMLSALWSFSLPRWCRPCEDIHTDCNEV